MAMSSQPWGVVSGMGEQPRRGGGRWESGGWGMGSSVTAGVGGGIKGVGWRAAGGFEKNVRGL